MQKKKIPQRMCLGCQQMKNKKELLRVVRTPESEIVIDTTGKKAGRGAYICADTACLQQAVKYKRLEKALSQPIEAAVYEALTQQLVKP